MCNDGKQLVFTSSDCINLGKKVMRMFFTGINGSRHTCREKKKILEAIIAFITIDMAQFKE